MVFTFFIAMLISMAGSFAAPSSIREVDFKNASYPWDGRPQAVPSTWKWLSGFPSRNTRLENGRRDFADDGYLLLTGITYGDLNGDRRDDAVVALHYGTGGTATWRFLYVYMQEDGQPKLVAIMECGSRAYGGLLATKVKNGLLVLDFEDSDLAVGLCCSKGYIRVQYRWQDDHFEETGIRKKGKTKLKEIPLMPKRAFLFL